MRPGVRSSNEFLVNLPTPPGPRRQLPAIVEHGSGFVVAWTDQAPGSPATAPTQLKLRILDADTLSGPEIQVSTAPIEPLIRPAMARLSDGNFIVVWADKRQEERIERNVSAAMERELAPSFVPIPSPGCTGSRWWSAWPTVISSSRGGRASSGPFTSDSRYSMRKDRRAASGSRNRQPPQRP